MGKTFYNGQGLNLSHPTKWKWGARRGRPWSDSDVECAKFLRHCGMKDAAIGKELGRSEKSVRHKIGYVATRKYTKSYRMAA